MHSGREGLVYDNRDMEGRKGVRKKCSESKSNKSQERQIMGNQRGFGHHESGSIPYCMYDHREAIRQGFRSSLARQRDDNTSHRSCYEITHIKF